MATKRPFHPEEGSEVTSTSKQHHHRQPLTKRAKIKNYDGSVKAPSDYAADLSRVQIRVDRDAVASVITFLGRVAGVADGVRDDMANGSASGRDLVQVAEEGNRDILVETADIFLANRKERESIRQEAGQLRERLVMQVHQDPQVEESGRLDVNGSSLNHGHHYLSYGTQPSASIKHASDTAAQIAEAAPQNHNHSTNHTNKTTTEKTPSYPPPLPTITDPILAAGPFQHPGNMSNLSGPPTKNNINTSKPKLPLTYERLEFLGDAYIEIISTTLIYERFAHRSAGQQAQIRELLVKNETLAEFARLYGFDERVSVRRDNGGKKGRSGETGGGGGGGGGGAFNPKHWTKVLADVFEAYIAALILSSPSPSSWATGYGPGYATAQAFLHALWEPQLRAIESDSTSNTATAATITDAKQQLARKLISPLGTTKLDYFETKPMQLNRAAGKQVYSMGVRLFGFGYEGLVLGKGVGQNKVQAGMSAAADALKRNQDVFERVAGMRTEEAKRRRKEREARNRSGDGSGHAKED